MMRGALAYIALAVFGMDAEAAVRVYRPTDPSEIVLRLGPSSELEATKPRTTSGASPRDSLQRAQLLQHHHQFREAERLLDEVLERNPRDREARLMRAQIRLHLDEPEQALRDCAALTPLVDALTTATCVAQARAALGDLKRAYALVVTALGLQRGEDTVRSWSAGVAAELASRLGDSRTAGEWYQEAYRLDPASHYARMTYADWLLSAGRHEEAQKLAPDRAAVTRAPR